MPLTQLEVDRLQAVGSRAVLDDDRVKGLKVVAEPNGVTFYALQYRLPRKNAATKVIQLGLHPGMQLADARKSAKRLLGQYIKYGVHPAAVLSNSTMRPGRWGWVWNIALAMLAGMLRGLAPSRRSGRRKRLF